MTWARMLNRNWQTCCLPSNWRPGVQQSVRCCCSSFPCAAGLTHGWSCRLKGTDVTVYAVHPGLIMTNIWSTKWATNGCMSKVIAAMFGHWFKGIQQVGFIHLQLLTFRRHCSVGMASKRRPPHGKYPIAALFMMAQIGGV